MAEGGSLGFRVVGPKNSASSVELKCLGPQRGPRSQVDHQMKSYFQVTAGPGPSWQRLDHSRGGDAAEKTERAKRRRAEWAEQAEQAHSGRLER